MLRVSAIQQHCHSDKKKSWDITYQLISQALSKPSNHSDELIVLQELHGTHYFCQTEDTECFSLAEPLKGETYERLSSVAIEFKAVVVGSIFEKRAAGIYHNTAIVVDSNGELAGFYRKMHIPDDPGFYEKFYFTPGDAITTKKSESGFSPIDTSVGKLGVLVCWDQWYPEAARLMALSGADVLIYPTAIGWDSRDPLEEQARQKEAWTLIQRSHAVSNNLPIISVNRVGEEPDPSHSSPGIHFWGGSFICGQQGEILAEATQDRKDEIIQADIDFQRTEEVRKIWPYFRDRRIDAYQNLLKRYND